MIQLDLPMPSCCLRCHLKTVEEDIYGEYFYYCTPLKEAIYGDKYKKRRFRVNNRFIFWKVKTFKEYLREGGQQ